MELKFEKAGCACLETVLQEVQNQEQTQELRLSDDMPDIGKVLAVWGSPFSGVRNGGQVKPLHPVE